MPTAILDILRQAYAIEVDGHTFYSMTADRATKPTIKRLFVRLAEDERQHQQYLREVAEHYPEREQAAFDITTKEPAFEAFADKVFTEQLRQEADGAEFEAGVISVAMMIEANSIACYTAAARSAVHDRVRTFYQYLCVWERQHLVALQNAYKAIRADFWTKSGL